METNLLMPQLTSLIADAMKKRDKVRLEALKMIKATFTEAQKSENVERDENGEPIIDVAKETKILQKMVKQAENAIDQFIKGGRNDLADAEKLQLEIIKEFLPKEASDEDVKKCTMEVCNRLVSEGKEVSMKSMRDVMAEVQKQIPTASGKVISEVVKNWK